MQHQNQLSPGGALVMFLVGIACFALAYVFKPGGDALVLGVAGAAFVGLSLLYGLVFGLIRLWTALFPPKPAESLNPGAFGSAKWADDDALRRFTLDQGHIVAFYPAPNTRIDVDMPVRAIRYDGDSHLLTVAPSGAGKGIGCVVPALLTHPGSAIVLDIKGENAAVTARHRREIGQTVHILDPFGMTGQPSSSFNPLDAMHPDDPDFVADCRSLAANIIFDPPGHRGEAHWNDAAIELVASLIAYVAAGGAQGPRGLSSVRELLTLEAGELEDLFEAMADHDHAFVSRGGKQMLQRPGRETASIVSTTQRHTGFLDDTRMIDSLGRSDVDFRTVKRTPTTLYLVLPGERLSAYNRWYRLLITVAMEAITRDPAVPKDKVLFMLDEMAQLGRMEPVLRAYTLLRGYGLQVWGIVQSLSQLKQLYGEDWETFIANAAVKQFFGVNDMFTARYVSDMLSHETIDTFGKHNLDDPKYSQSSTGRLLMKPEEIIGMPPLEMIAFMAGEPPLRVIKPVYFRDNEAAYFAGKYDPNPYVS